MGKSGTEGGGGVHIRFMDENQGREWGAFFLVGPQYWCKEYLSHLREDQNIFW